MCGVISEILNSDQDNIIGSQTSQMRVMDDCLEWERKALRKDVGFLPILDGGVVPGRTLTIRCQVAEKDGHLIYNGRAYNRSCWSWRPPKVIRMQGRLAKDPTDPMNTKPEISIYTEKGKLLLLDACPCGGELRKDHRDVLYCTECYITYE